MTLGNDSKGGAKANVKRDEKSILKTQIAIILLVVILILCRIIAIPVVLISKDVDGNKANGRIN